MINTFKQKAASNIFMLFILSILVKWPFFVSSPITVDNKADGFFYKYLVAHNPHPDPLILTTLAVCLIFFQAILVNRLVQNQRLLPRSNFLTAMAYIMISSLVPAWNTLSSTLIYNTFLIIILFQVFNIYHKEAKLSDFFNIGLLLGLTIFLFIPGVLIIFWVLIALFILRPFRLKEILIYLLGIFTPLYFLLVITFVFTNNPVLALLPSFSLYLPEKLPNNWVAANIAIVALVAIFGLYYVQENMRRVLVSVRKTWSLISLLLIFCVLIPFLEPGKGYVNFAVAIIPLSFLHASAYYYIPVNWVSRILFWGYLLLLTIPALLHV